MTDSIRKGFLLLLGVCYVALGIFLFFRKVIGLFPWDQILAGLFVIYGSWRMYRAIKM
jgi:hypothetical protein